MVYHPYLGWTLVKFSSDPKKIAYLFCKYFSNIGPNLAHKITASEKSHSSFLPPKLVNTIFLEVASEEKNIEKLWYFVVQVLL